LQMMKTGSAGNTAASSMRTLSSLPARLARDWRRNACHASA
jgi:hypothetical protein